MTFHLNILPIAESTGSLTSVRSSWTLIRHYAIKHIRSVFLRGLRFLLAMAVMGANSSTRLEGGMCSQMRLSLGHQSGGVHQKSLCNCHRFFVPLFLSEIRTNFQKVVATLFSKSFMPFTTANSFGECAFPPWPRPDPPQGTPSTWSNR